MISVAIDGPAGAGKSTLARRLAAELGYIYVDTGAMFRAIGLYALRAGKDPDDAAAVNALLPEIELHLASIDGEQHIYLKEEDVSTVAVKCVVVTTDKLSDDLGEQIVKAIYEHLDRMKAAHAVGKYITKDTALEGMSVKMNAGAEKYLKAK